MGRIIVGVEGSGGATGALKWAIEEAKIRSAKIEVITAYSTTFVSNASDFNYVPIEPLDLQEQVQAMQQEIVTSVVGDEDVEIECKMVKGRAADVLITAGQDAEMVVVGSRGRGGFKGLLLGSVSHQIVQHCKCPVVIVPFSPVKEQVKDQAKKPAKKG